MQSANVHLMGENQRAILGAALLIVAVAGVWSWVREPADPDSPAAVTAEQQPDLHARALLKVVASRTSLSAEDREVRWLEGELRYLLTRAQVALARPQGPYDAADGATVFTLRLVVGERPGEPTELALLTPAGQVERTTTIDPDGSSRLSLVSAVASRLPAFLPRGDTGVTPEQFIGTADAETYETFAQVQMAAATSGKVLQSTIRSRDTPIDTLEALTRRQPGFARAWAELAMHYLGIEGEDATSLTAIAEKAARQALSLDTRLAAAHAALGIAQQRQGQWLPADTSLAQALSLDPALRPALDAFGCLLIDTGRTSYALLIGEQGAAVADPEGTSGSCLEYARMASSTVPEDSGTPADPAAARPRALAALLDTRVEDARILLAASTGREVRDDPWFGAVVRALRDPGSRPAALRAITLAASDGTLDAATEIMLGIALKQPDFVFNRMLRLNAERQEVPTRFLWIRQSQFLREHPRLVAVTQQLGLTAYWKERERPDACSETPELAICR